MNEVRTIGDKGNLPWYIPEDLKRFKSLTQGDIVVMGRNTFESLPPNMKPLPDRENVVITSDPSSLMGKTYKRSFSVASSFEAVLEKYKDDPRTIWVIGGAYLFEKALPYIDQIELTYIKNNYVDGDTKLPPFEHEFHIAYVETIVKEPFNRVYGYTYKRLKT